MDPSKLNTMSETQLPALEATSPPHSRPRVGRWLAIGVMALVMGLIWLNLGQVQQTENQDDAAAAAAIPIQAELGALAPDFSLPVLDGQTVRLSEFRGKPVILNFWATWCPPCRAEMPALEEIWQQYGRGDVVVLGVDQGEGTAVVERFINTKVHTTFPILMDQRQTIGDTYFVRSLPTTFFIDPNGFIQEIRVGGPLSLDFLQGQVQRLQGE